MSELLVDDMATRGVPGDPPKKRKRVDPRVAAIFTAIDAVRDGYGFSDWNDLADKAGIARSTLSAWRLGETTPDFVRLDDAANVVGLSVGLVLDSRAQEILLRGVRPMPSDLAQTIALLVDRLNTNKEKLELLSKVREFVQDRVSGSRPPRGGDGK